MRSPSRYAAALAAALAASSMAGPATAARLAAFDGTAPLPEAELDAMRAGFVSGGLFVSMGLEFVSTVNGELLTRTVVGPVVIGGGSGAPTLATTADGGIQVIQTTNAGATTMSLTIAGGHILNTVRNAADGQVIRSTTIANIEVFGMRDTVRSTLGSLRVLDITRAAGYGRR